MPETKVQTPLTFIQLPLKQKQELPNTHHSQLSSQPSERPENKRAWLRVSSFTLQHSSKPLRPQQYSLGFPFSLHTVSSPSARDACVLTITIIENQRAEKKSLQGDIMFFFKKKSHYLFFDGQLTSGTGVLRRGREVVEFVCACQ